MKSNLIAEINKLKQEKNAVILAHTYQEVEIDEVADFKGDSLYLSQMAAKTDADIIVFAGVYFMAETAKILSPDKKVLLPRLESGCMMADMINEEQIKAFKAKYPNKPVVCYVNSSAKVKAHADICCTSSNAINVVKSLNEDTVLFVPDKNLGSYVAEQTGVNVICYDGCCPTHLLITKDVLKENKKQYPNAEILIHPECTKDTLKMADFVGSTTQIINYVAKSDKKEFIIATEKGVQDRLKRDYPNKTFVLPSEKIVCQNMKWHKLEDIYNALKNEEHEIFVDEQIANSARNTIERMIKING